MNPSLADRATKHTPGPWHAREWQCRGVTSVGRITDNAIGFEQIAECSGLGRQVSAEQEEADARLIAAAPDLLSLLRRMEEQYDDNPTVGLSLFIDDIRAAIAKAEGAAA